MKISGNQISAHNIHKRRIILPPFILPKKLAIKAKGRISSIIATKVTSA
jgi:hypothetical protein